MSLVNLANVCSHIQNATRARLSITCVPSTRLTLEILLSLQRSGFISSVSRGGVEEPPPPSAVLGLPSSTNSDEDIDIASRRLWLGLKYWNNEPVLSSLQLVSRPSRRVWMNSVDLARLLRGKSAGFVDGIRRPGECMFLTTDRGVMEIREAVERRIGGMLLVRAY